MNLITKLLMENEVEISAFEVYCLTSQPRKELVIRIKDLNENVELPGTKKELLEEAPERIFVSSLEWGLMNYWIENDVQEVHRTSNDNITLVGEKESQIYYQTHLKHKQFTFLKVDNKYKLKELLSRCALIEG